MTAELELAARVVELVRASAGPATQAEVFVDRTEQALTRFANSAIHQNVADASTTVRLRVHDDGRTATASTALVHPDGLADLVGRALAGARRTPVDRAWPGLAAPAAAPACGAVDDSTATATPQRRAAAVRAFVDAAGGCSAAGYCRTVSWRGAFANSAGQTATGATTDATLDGVARAGSSDGVARGSSYRLAGLDGAVLGARAAAKARAGAGAVDAPPGRYEVVLEQTAVVDILLALVRYGFNGKALAERRSFVEIGAGQFDPAVTLVDDPCSTLTPGAPFDVEGTPRRRLELVRAGTTLAVAHDRRTAAALGAESNGRALAGAASFGPVALNLAMLPGTAGGPGAVSEAAGPAADASVAALVARVERGLLVTDNWYTRVLDPRALVVTGLTRNGVWLIEHGEVTRPVTNLRFTQSYPEALAPGAVLGVGTAVVGAADGGTGVVFAAPALHLASWNYTGGAGG